MTNLFHEGHGSITTKEGMIVINLGGYLMLLSLVALYGCGGVSKEIAAKYIDQRSDVGYDGSAEDKLSRYMTDLVIKAQIKRNLAGFYILESKDSLHGKLTYPFLLNIDGSTCRLADGRSQGEHILLR